MGTRLYSWLLLAGSKTMCHCSKKLVLICTPMN
jgi:hypothetical protein